jgi:hypothetical protein
MKINPILGGIIVIILVVGLSGCNEQKENDNNEQTNDSNLKNIIGNWYKEESYDDITYFVVYEFYSNLSFYSGIWDSSSHTVSSYVWGNFEIQDDRIYLNVTGENESSSLLKFSISEDGNSLTLFYEDEENYDVFTRQS